MSNEKIKKASFQASIRAEDRDIFHTAIITKIAHWSFVDDSTLSGTFSERCLTTKLIELFKRVGVDYQVKPNSEPGSVLVERLPGVDVCTIEQDGKAHVRIKFDGDTRSKLEHRRERIQAFLDSQNIPSEDYCIFVCISKGTKQNELTNKYLGDMEKAKKME